MGLIFYEPLNTPSWVRPSLHALSSLQVVKIKLLIFCVFLVVNQAFATANHLYVRVKNSTQQPLNGFLVVSGFGFDGESFFPYESTTPLSLAAGTTSLVVHLGPVEEGGTNAEGTFAYFKTETATSDYVGASYIATAGAELTSVAGGNFTDPWSTYPEGAPLLIDVTYSPHATTLDAKKTVWMVDDESLTPELFREGVDKIVAGFQIPEAPASSGGGSGMTLEEFQTTKTEGVAQAQYSANAANPTVEAMSAAGTAASADAVASMASYSAPTLGTVSPVTSANSIFVIESAIIGTINLDPAISASLSAYCAYVKIVSGWILVLVFTWWAWAEFRGIVNTAVVSQQAHGNPVVGGTGAQATALLAATLLAVVFIGLPAAYWAAVTIDMSGLSTNPFAGTNTYIQAGLYLLNLVFPYDLCLSLLTAAFFIRRFGTIMVLSTNALVKFIVP